MKKIIGFVLCFVIVIAFSSCNRNAEVSSDVSDYTDEVSSEINSLDESSSESTSTQDIVTSSESSVPSTSSEKTESSKTSSTSSVQSEATEDWYESGCALNKITGKELLDIIGIESSNLTVNKDFGGFLQYGSFVNLTYDDNIAYFIFTYPNVAAAYDMENFKLLYSISLAGRPAEVHVDGNNLLISFPDHNCIKIYEKTTLTEIKTILLPNEVSSFCMNGNIVYYSEDDQHCYAYYTNLSTNETKPVADANNNPISFYYPKLLLNKEDGILYIGESLTTGSVLYYHNASDCTLISKYEKDNYGKNNGKRTLFFANDSVFWAGLRFDANNPENILGQYNGDTFYHADEKFVITENGFYDTNTRKYLGNIKNTTDMIITDNESLVAVCPDFHGYVALVVVR